MASPIQLSHTSSVVSQRVLLAERGLDSAPPSPTPRAPSPAHRVTSDSLDTGAAFASVTEELSFAPPRAPSPVSSLTVLSRDGSGLHPLQVEPLAFIRQGDGNTVFGQGHPGLSLPLPASPVDCATTVESSDVGGLVTKTPLQPQREKKDPLLSESEASDFLATLCDRISSFITEGIARFVNWIASWFFPSSDEEDSRSQAGDIAQQLVVASGVLETASASSSESPHDLGALHSAILQGVEELRSESPRTQDFSVDEAPSK